MAIEAYKAKLCSIINSVLIVGLGASASLLAGVGGFIGINRKEIAFWGASADSVLVKI